MFWPGISHDLMLARQKCSFCNKHAPSHSKLPPVEPHIPSVPFEAIVSDFFDMLGFHYLVIADRLTGWPEVWSESGDKRSRG